LEEGSVGGGWGDPGLFGGLRDHAGDEVRVGDEGGQMTVHGYVAGLGRFVGPLVGLYEVAEGRRVRGKSEPLGWLQRLDAPQNRAVFDITGVDHDDVDRSSLCRTWRNRAFVFGLLGRATRARVVVERWIGRRDEHMVRCYLLRRDALLLKLRARFPDEHRDVWGLLLAGRVPHAPDLDVLRRS